MELALIDAIGPFFRGDSRRRINWSKIAFDRLPVDGAEREARWTQIREDLDTFAEKVAALGYNAVTLDDVAHLSDHPSLEPEVRNRNAVFREEFRHLFRILQNRGLKVFVTADFLTTTPAVDETLKRDIHSPIQWFRDVLEGVFEEFPEIAGVILRIGESDGHDVRDTLRSRLFVRTAREVNRMLLGLLPSFEKFQRRLIFRTWTVGAYLIGDLIWHRGRIAQALEGINSPAFVLSMKYGESDFFRYLPLNRHFFRVDHPKIIEFQARREYEGAGEYPSFIGWECEAYARELSGATNVVGLSTWCQTGGWHGFKRLAFLDENAIWIELNVAAIIATIRDGQTVEQVVERRFGIDGAPHALELLRRSDLVIRQLLYIEEFAREKRFFRRVRIPPLLHVYWDSVFVHDALRKVISHFVQDPEQAVRSGEAAFENFSQMEPLAKQLGLPVEDIQFMRDTFGMILLARRYYLLPEDPEFAARLKAAKKEYKRRWPRELRPRYRIRVSLESSRFTPRTTAWLARLLIRRQRGYRRVMDHLFTLTALAWIYRLFHARHHKALPKFLRKTAMGVDSLFK